MKSIEVISSIATCSATISEIKNELSLIEIKNQILKSPSLPLAHFRAECFKASYGLNKNNGIEYIVSQVSLYSYIMMTSEKNNVLDAPLIAKAINSFEKNDIQILLDVLVGKGFASSSIAQGLSHMGTTCPTLQTELQSYIAEYRPQFCQDSPYCSVLPKLEIPSASASPILSPGKASPISLKRKGSKSGSRHHFLMSGKSAPDSEESTEDRLTPGGSTDSSLHTSN